MFYKVLGWVAIIVSVLLLIPSVVPGAVSVIASWLAFLILLVSILTIQSGNFFYFKVTATISAIGLFIANDSLRLYGALPGVPWVYKLTCYGAFIVICILAVLYAKKRATVSTEKT
ncbi:MAG: hypothetical protein CSB47_00800 [Proteobacteria bacterium]|nr:MAG: hypothetical protein CSB47_00800 [Pseudomonadota bacterium]